MNQGETPRSQSEGAYVDALMAGARKGVARMLVAARSIEAKLVAEVAQSPRPGEAAKKDALTALNQLRRAAEVNRRTIQHLKAETERRCAELRRDVKEKVRRS